MISKEYSVYMIHLSKDVLVKDTPEAGQFTAKNFLKANPNYDLKSKIKPCVYIGYTSINPEERYIQHKNRIPKKKLSKTGKPVRNWNPYAKKHEQNLANFYRKKGYAVWGGQKE